MEKPEPAKSVSWAYTGGCLTWKLVHLLVHAVHSLQQVIHLGFDLAQLSSDGVQLLSLDCWQRGRVCASPGSGGRRQCCQDSLACEGHTSSPSPAGDGCAPSLTLYLPCRQLTSPGSLVGTKAVLDPRAHVGPPDLGRCTVD